MKPPLCHLCGRDMLGHLDGGDLVAFADYRALPAGVAGHPHGAEWFCGEHLAAARESKQLDYAEAMQRLRDRYGGAPPPAHD